MARAASSVALILGLGCSGDNTTYRIGGTVAGLAGSLVLQNNGGDDLSVANDGAFTFAKRAGDGAAYAVTVATQPHGQTCTVANGSGKVAGADVTSVLVSCTPPGGCVLENPSADSSSRFGATVRTLANGNIVVTDPVLNLGGNTAAGAVYLFDGNTCGLISTLTGSMTNQVVGGGGVGVLTNGNFVVFSLGPTGFWATFVDGVHGLEGAVSATNSLVPGATYTGGGNPAVPCLTGQPALPRATCAQILENIQTVSPRNSPLNASGSQWAPLGIPPITAELLNFVALPGGNYLVAHPLSNSVTFGSGLTGVAGEVSAANSLIDGPEGVMTFATGILSPCSLGNSVTERGNFTVGSLACGGLAVSASGLLGATGQIPTPNNAFPNLTELKNGNFVVNDAGAISLYNGTTAAKISTLTGAPDSTIRPLTNGNFVVRTPSFGGGAGAVTFVDGSTGLNGAIGAGNSLVGAAATDAIGSGDITALSNGNYLVNSPSFGGGLGAVTWGNGATGTTGTVGIGNSLVGAAATDHVGSSVALTNGNYVVRSPSFGGNRGAATFGNGASGITGVVSASNSLVGAAASDSVALNILALKNGNYLVLSASFGARNGAATFGNGSTGTVGVVSSANSLVGAAVSDHVGGIAVTLLSNGAYVVRTPGFSGGIGAVTFGSGTTGIAGVLDASNSLVAGTAADGLASGGITPLTNGNYVVLTPNWSGGLGAVTFGSGTTGVSGAISATNSLVGSTAGDRIGNGVFHDEVAGRVPPFTTVGSSVVKTEIKGVVPLAAGGYVVMSPDFSGGIGAATFGGQSGIVGTIGASNSLVGTVAGDHVSGGGVRALPGGGYVVMSPLWSNGTAFAAGAVTFGSGAGGVAGAVSASNSLVGTNAGDFVGFTGWNFSSGLPAAPALTSAAIYQTLFAQHGGTGNGLSDLAQFGIPSATSILFGQITVLSNGNYVVMSPYYGGERGAATLGSGTSGVSGPVSPGNSVVGAVARGYLGSVVQEDPVHRIFIAGGLVEMATQSLEVRSSPTKF